MSNSKVVYPATSYASLPRCQNPQCHLDNGVILEGKPIVLGILSEDKHGLAITVKRLVCTDCHDAITRKYRSISKQEATETIQKSVVRRSESVNQSVRSSSLRKEADEIKHISGAAFKKGATQNERKVTALPDKSKSQGPNVSAGYNKDHTHHAAETNRWASVANKKKLHSEETFAANLQVVRSTTGSKFESIEDIGEGYEFSQKSTIKEVKRTTFQMLMPELRSRTPGFTWNHDEIVWRDIRSWNKLATQDQDEAHWYNRTEFWKEEAKKGKGGTVVKSWCPPTAATKKPSFALCVSKKEWARYQAFLDDMEMKALEEERNQQAEAVIAKDLEKNTSKYGHKVEQTYQAHKEGWEWETDINARSNHERKSAQAPSSEFDSEFEAPEKPLKFLSSQLNTIQLSENFRDSTSLEVPDARPPPIEISSGSESDVVSSERHSTPPVQTGSKRGRDTAALMNTPPRNAKHARSSSTKDKSGSTLDRDSMYRALSLHGSSEGIIKDGAMIMAEIQGRFFPLIIKSVSDILEAQFKWTCGGTYDNSYQAILRVQHRNLGVGGMKVAKRGVLVRFKESGGFHEVDIAVKQFFTRTSTGHTLHDAKQQLTSITLELNAHMMADALLKLAIATADELLVSQKYKAQIPSPLPSFVPAGMFILRSPDGQGISNAFMAEKLVDVTKFTKWVGNAHARILVPTDGLSEDQKLGEYFQFLQHLMFMKTYGAAYVADFQGVYPDLTDPQIMTSPHLYGAQYGNGNIPAVFERFQEQHDCSSNRFCLMAADDAQGDSDWKDVKDILAFNASAPLSSHV